MWQLFWTKIKKVCRVSLLKKVVSGYFKAPYTSVYIFLLILAASQHVCMRVWHSINAQNTQQEMLQVVRKKLVKAEK